MVMKNVHIQWTVCNMLQTNVEKLVVITRISTLTEKFPNPLQLTEIFHNHMVTLKTHIIVK